MFHLLPLGWGKGVFLFVCFLVVFSTFFPIFKFFLFLWLIPHLMTLWLILLPSPLILGFVLGSCFRSVCIACIFLVSECWFLVLGIQHWFPKFSWDLWKHKTWLCIKFIGLSHLPALVLCCVCMCVRLPHKTSENHKSWPSFFACSILSRMFNVITKIDVKYI